MKGDIDKWNAALDADIDALKKKLEEAIEEENYELATKLRDEIKRREEESN